MRNSFKISTFVLKLALFAFIVSSFILMTAKVQAKSENAKMIDQHVRLSLWYTGIEAPIQANGAELSLKEVPEELTRALDKLQLSQLDQ